MTSLLTAFLLLAAAPTTPTTPPPAPAGKIQVTELTTSIGLPVAAARAVVDEHASTLLHCLDPLVVNRIKDFPADVDPRLEVDWTYTITDDEPARNASTVLSSSTASSVLLVEDCVKQRMRWWPWPRKVTGLNKLSIHVRFKATLTFEPSAGPTSLTRARAALTTLCANLAAVPLKEEWQSKAIEDVLVSWAKSTPTPITEHVFLQTSNPLIDNARRQTARVADELGVECPALLQGDKYSREAPKKPKP